MSDISESATIPLKVDGVIVGTASITERGELVSCITSKESWAYFKELMHASELTSVSIQLEYREDPPDHLPSSIHMSPVRDI